MELFEIRLDECFEAGRTRGTTGSKDKDKKTGTNEKRQTSGSNLSEGMRKPGKGINCNNNPAPDLKR